MGRAAISALALLAISATAPSIAASRCISTDELFAMLSGTKYEHGNLDPFLPACTRQDVIEAMREIDAQEERDKANVIWAGIASEEEWDRFPTLRYRYVETYNQLRIMTIVGTVIFIALAVGLVFLLKRRRRIARAADAATVAVLAAGVRAARAASQKAGNYRQRVIAKADEQESQPPR